MTEGSQSAGRGQWRSRLGFVMAAAGSAVGLGNIWKFPYITGENGGGFFVLIYLACVVLVGMPIMMAEILVGRATQASPVGAVAALCGGKRAWSGLGWLFVAGSFVILSYYSVVAGWALHYTWLSLSGVLTSSEPAELEALFDQVYASPSLNLGWHFVFMALTVAIVMRGVQHGIERWARVLMPTMFAMLLLLMLYVSRLPGFVPALDFVFGAHAERLTPKGVLEALGHAFFTLSLGMGCMLTYGSYFERDGDLVSASIAIALMDTAVALLACMVLFPITFSHGMPPAAGTGLVFKSIPVALSDMAGGRVVASVFFALLVFAALTSAISLLEVTTAYFVDERGWPRAMAAPCMGAAIALFGVPSALSGSSPLFGAGFSAATGLTFFGLLDHVASSWMLPLGGLGLALFVSLRVDPTLRQAEFTRGTRLGRIYGAWLWLLRWVVPVGVVAAFLHAVGVL